MSAKGPLYPRLLRLRHVRPNAWQRALLGEGAVVVAALLVLADVATAWALVVVPVAVALVVKAHDVLTGLLRPADDGPQPAPGRVRRARPRRTSEEQPVSGAEADARG